MVRSNEVCCVPNCGKKRCDNLTLHKFPNPNKDHERFRTWLYAIGGDILALDNQYIFNNRRMCHIHFEQKYLTRYGRLSANAVPTLHLQDMHARQVPLMDVTNKHNIATEGLSLPVPSQEKGILDPSSKETADVILFFDELFDSVNGGFMNEKKRPGKELLGALTPLSSHQTVWTRSKEVLNTMKFLTLQGRKSHVPSVGNWLRTIENLEYLKKQLFEKYDIKSIWLRHFNQDPLENFFGCVRSHGARNNNPTCAQFEVAFAALLINNLNSLHSPGSNCEKDQGRGFKSISKIFFEKPATRGPIHISVEINFDHVRDQVLIGLNNKKKDLKICAQIEYVTGYILRKCKPIFKHCKSCNACLYDKNMSSGYIKLKEYKNGKAYLSYPAETLVEMFSNVQDLVTNVIKSDCDINNIKQYLKVVIETVIQFDFIKCTDHKEALAKKIIDLSCGFFLHNWCKDLNKLLRGSRNDFDPGDQVQEMTRNYYLKRRK